MHAIVLTSINLHTKSEVAYVYNFTHSWLGQKRMGHVTLATALSGDLSSVYTYFA